MNCNADVHVYVYEKMKNNVGVVLYINECKLLNFVQKVNIHVFAVKNNLHLLMIRNLESTLIHSDYTLSFLEPIKYEILM